ncbi:hypothetical protein F53441_1064 [Fusarium austroafricanum]|uniref:Nephrocystin 3-like N-terminal domain-containing protein n=1 Tax=Fusarium austroafricanum TaxID=2364996 RepID=A0A8H4KX02_9HYPO|nr:hypothetical protein F53441_1064 [Fusarium austroafricanum]
MSDSAGSAWRSLLGCHELCVKASASLPPDQVSLRSLSAANTTPALQPQGETSKHALVNCETDYSASNSCGTLGKQPEEFRQLWNEAMVKVETSKDGEKLAEVLQAQNQTNRGDFDVTLTTLISRLEAEMRRVGLQGKMANTMEKIAPHLNRLATVGNIAVSANPNPAALPWAAVRFLLLNLTAGEEIRAKVVQGIVEITILVFECNIYQELYLGSPIVKDASSRTNLRKMIIDALSQCIRFLGFALCRQQAVAKALTDAFRVEDFSSYLKDLSTSKRQLHDAAFLCKMYQNSQSRDQLTDLHDLIVEMRGELSEEYARSQFKDLLLDPKDAFDHVYHPANSFCLEGTRQTVQDIYDWAHDTTSPTICWLPGLAGTGKSTISRTIAYNLKGKTLGASFFFKKGAGNRGDGRLVFSIIAYQLALNFPPIRRHIVDAIQEDPLSAMASMDVQWRRLVRDPLVKLRDKQFTNNITLVIDALDECDQEDRSRILELLTTSCPRFLKVFITNRSELDIEVHFATEQRLHREIVLHRVKMEIIESDITIFLTHTLSRSVPLFIAATTFTRMIKDHHWAKSPDYKVDFIIEKSAKVNSAYEAIYKPVLSLILAGAPDEDQDDATDSFVTIIGSFILLASPLSTTALSSLLNVDVRDILSQFDPLRSVIDIPSDDSPVKHFHLSFRDYLLSKSAANLQVDETKTHASLASRCLEPMRTKLKADVCGLGLPGKSLSEVDPEVISEHVSSDVQYACLYWIHHIKASGNRVRDGGDEHGFLQCFFLNWVEVLCLLRKVSDALLMLEEFQIMIDELFIKDCSIESVAFPDDGNFLCAVCVQCMNLKSIGRVHDLATGKCVREYEIFDKPHHMRLSPNGQWMAANTKESIILSRWDPDSDPSWVTLGPQSEHDVIQFSSDGGFVATVSRDTDMVKVWKTSSGECLHIFEFETQPPQWEFCLTKDRPAVALDHFQIVVFDLNTGEVSHSINSYIKAGPVISDSGTLLTAQSLDGAIRVWELSSERLVKNPDIHVLDVEVVTPIADDNTLLSFGSGDIKIWDIESGNCKERLNTNATASTETTLVAAATDAPAFAILKDYTVEICKIDPLCHIRTIDRVFSCIGDRFYCLVLSSDGQRLVVGSSGDVSTVEIWDVKSASLVQKFDARLMDWPNIAFSSDGSLIAYVLMESIEARYVPSLEARTIISALYPRVSTFQSLTMNDERLMGIYRNSQVQVWDVYTGQCLFLSQPGPWLKPFHLGRTFIDLETIAGILVSENARTDDILKKCYIHEDGVWAMRDKERLLWLPPDYRVACVCMIGTTMVIGTVSGWVLFLYMEE